MSVKEYLAIDEEIKTIYMNVCSPCLRTHLNRCTGCATMQKYIKLQEKKKQMEANK